jgi:hypothetical protein
MRLLTTLSVAILSSSSAFALQGQEGSIGPDVAVSGVAGEGQVDVEASPVIGGIRSFAMGSTSCNVGTEKIDWIAGNGHQHPCIGQNLFRIHDGRIEQLGYSFLKHSFFALSQPNCTFLPCQSTNGSELGIGCADTYGAYLNDGNFGGSKRDIVATSGFHNSDSSPVGGNSVHRGRLQVLESELLTEGAHYIAEIQYMSEEDQMAGLARNNASWRELFFTFGAGSPPFGGPIRRYDPAIYAWADVDPLVTVNEVPNLDEGGPSIHGWFFVGSRAELVGTNEWRYTYAVQNFTSEQGARSFQIHNPCGATISDPFFRDVEAHSGDPWSPVDWNFSTSSGLIRWSTDTFAQDPNANAIRWGTLYTFGFTADMPPGESMADMDLFKAGTTNLLSTTVSGPCGPLLCTTAKYCDSTLHSGGSRSEISMTGSASFAANDMVLHVFGALQGEPALFYYGTNQVEVPFGNGIRCVGGTTFRVNPPILTGLFGDAQIALDFGSAPFSSPGAGQVQPGVSHNFQVWFRDPGDPNGFNLSDGLYVAYCP